MVRKSESTIDPRHFSIETVYQWLTSRSTADARKADANSIWVSCVVPQNHKNADSGASLKLNSSDQVFYCFPCGLGGGVTDLIIAAGKHREASGPNDRTKAMNWLRDQSQLPHVVADATPSVERKRKKRKYERLAGEYFEALHPYTDVDGTVRYWVVRLRGERNGIPTKTFEYFSPIDAPVIAPKEWVIEDHTYRTKNGERVFSVRAIGGRVEGKSVIRFEWVMPGGSVRHIAKTRHAEPIPYRLPELVAAAAAGRVAFCIEGELKADVFAELGFAVFSFPSGSGFNVPESWLTYFRGLSLLVILADADTAGRKSAKKRQTQFSAVVRTIVLDTWPERTDGHDYKDEIYERRAAGVPDAVLAREVRTLVSAAIKKPRDTRPVIAPTIEVPYVAVQPLAGGPVRVMPLSRWERQTQTRFRVTPPMSRDLAETVTSDFAGWLTPRDMRSTLPRNITQRRRLSR